MAARPTPPPAGARAARVAVGAVFAANGAVFASWVPRIPEVQADLGLSTAALGTALLGVGAGALAGSVLAGGLIGRFGSRRATAASGVALCATLPLLAVAGSWAALLAALAVAGLLDAVTDAAMNVQALAVEHRYRRSILNGLHALWSLGGIAGALTGSAAAGAGVPVGVHLLVAAGVLAAVVLAAARPLLPASADRRAAPPAAGGPRRRLPVRSLGLIMLLAVCASLAEQAPADWSAVHLANDLGAPAGVAGLGYVAFSGAMLVMRLLGDRAVDRWGVAATTRATVLLGAGGFAAGLASGTTAGVVAGFACFGFGLATAHPALYAAAGSLPGVSAGAGIGAFLVASRLGIMVGPVLIGAVGEAVDLRAGLLVAVGAALCVPLLGRGLVRGEPEALPAPPPPR